MSAKIDKYLPAVKPYQPEGKRILGLDVLKLIAFFMVNMHHCTVKFCSINGHWITYGNWGSDMIYYIWNYMFPMAVPLFLTVSGYLLLGRKNASYGYSFKRIFGILKISFVAELICTIVRCVAIHQKFDISLFFKTFLEGYLLSDGYYYVTWFLGTLIILYLFYPLLNKVYLSHTKGFIGIMAGCFLIQSLFFLRTLGVGSEYLIGEGEIIQTYRIWNWVFYFCLGGLLKRYRIFWRVGTIWFAVAISLINTFVFQMIMALQFDRCWFEMTYGSPVCILNVVAVFCFVLSRKIEWKWLKMVPQLFFPAFIISCLTVNAWASIIVTRYSSPWALLLYIFCANVSALIAAMILTKIPILKNLLRT